MNEGTTNKTNDSDAWSIEDSKRLYNIEQWGQEYFSINNNGNLAIFPEQDSNGPCIDMGEVIDEIKGYYSIEEAAKATGLSIEEVYKQIYILEKVSKETKFKDISNEVPEYNFDEAK